MNQPVAVRSHRELWFWIGAFAVFLLFLFVFHRILLPFVAGMALAYMLDPLLHVLMRRGFTRLWATLTILIGFLVILIVVLVLLVPLIVTQLV